MGLPLACLVALCLALTPARSVELQRGKAVAGSVSGRCGHLGRRIAWQEELVILCPAYGVSSRPHPCRLQRERGKGDRGSWVPTIPLKWSPSQSVCLGTAPGGNTQAGPWSVSMGGSVGQGGGQGAHRPRYRGPRRGQAKTAPLHKRSLQPG